MLQVTLRNGLGRDGGEGADQCHVSRKQKREPKCLGVGFPLTPGCSVASICSAVPQTLNHSPLAPRLLRPSLGGAKLLTTSKARQSRTEEPRRASAQPRCARRSSCPSTRPALHPLSSKGLRRVPAYGQPGAEPSRAACSLGEGLVPSPTRSDGVGSEHGRGRAGSLAFLRGLSKRKGVKDRTPLLSLLYAPRMEGRQPGALHRSQLAGKKRV